LTANQLGSNGNLLAINKRKFSKLNAQARESFDAAGFFRFHYLPANGFAGLGHDHPIHYQGPCERCGKSIAGMIAV
jgi:hypothetical protein